MKKWSRASMLLLLVGCGADPATGDPATTGPADEGVASPFERDLASKLDGCLGCHREDASSGVIDLTDIWAQIDMPSRQTEMPLIESGNHLQSYLWHKVAGTHGVVGGLGQRMPRAGAHWSDDDVELLARWIDLDLPR